MRVLLLDTNVVSILFKPDNALHQRCLRIAADHQWFISFMTRAELLFWPRANQWGTARRDQLHGHINLCTTLFADEATCELWAGIMAVSRAAGRPITPSDAWVAATARQWNIPLVTADYRDFEHLDGLTLIPVT